MIVITEYSVKLPVKHSLRIAVASDIHSSRKYSEIADMIAGIKPDMILIPGDLCHTAGDCDVPLKFLRLAVKTAPVYYTFGNHEADTDGSFFDINGVHLLNDKFESFGDVVIGGLRSGYIGQHQSDFKMTPEPNLDFLDAFEKEQGVKILLSHHPEYYPRYLEGRDIDLIFSGHAHGGQWRFFGRGVFAPGQGFLPKYTSGMHGSMIVSKGLANKQVIPRIFNKPEILLVEVEPQ